MCIYIHICFGGFFSQILFPCCCSVTQLCPTLREPMDCSTPGFPVLHYLPEFFQTHVHWVNDTNHLILCHPLLLLPSIFPASGSFPISQFFPPGGHSIGALASASVFPMNIQSWFLLWLTGFFFFSLLSRELPRVFPQFESINSLSHSLYGPNLTSIYDYSKTIALTLQTIVGKVMSLLFNTI